MKPNKFTDKVWEEITSLKHEEVATVVLHLENVKPSGEEPTLKEYNGNRKAHREALQARLKKPKEVQLDSLRSKIRVIGGNFYSDNLCYRYTGTAKQIEFFAASIEIAAISSLNEPGEAAICQKDSSI